MYSMVLMAALTTGADLPDFGRRGWGCCGCYGGYGWGGWGRGYGGYGYGGWGGGYGGWGGGYGGWGGGYGGWGGWGGWGYVSAPLIIPTYMAPTVIVSNTLPTAITPTRSLYYNPDTSPSKRATVIIHLPAKATLTVDGKATSSTSPTRRFYSPPLQAGKSYTYVFEARMERDGKTVKADRRVEVCAGDQREITITMPDLDRTTRRSAVGEHQVRNARH